MNERVSLGRQYLKTERKITTTDATPKSTFYNINVPFQLVGCMLAPQVVDQRPNVPAQHVEASESRAENTCEAALFAVRLDDEAVLDAEDAVRRLAVTTPGLLAVINDNLPYLSGPHG